MTPEELKRIETLFELARWDQAKHELRDLIAADPEDALPYAMLARCHEETEEKGALQLAKKAYSLDPEDLFVGYTYATLQILTRPRVAAAVLRRLLEANPDSAPLFHALAVVSYNDGKDEQALDLVSRALELDPESDIYKATLVMCKSDLGHKDALDTSRRNLTDNPAFRSLLTYGNTLLENRQHEEAYEVIVESLRIDPKDRQAQAALKEAVRRKWRIYEFTSRIRALLWRHISFGAKDGILPWLAIAAVVGPIALSWRFLMKHQEVLIPLMTLIWFVLGMRPAVNLVLWLYPRGRRVLHPSDFLASLYWIFAFGGMVVACVGAVREWPYMFDLAVASGLLWLLLASIELSHTLSEQSRIRWLHALLVSAILGFPIYLWVSEWWRRV